MEDTIRLGRQHIYWNKSLAALAGLILLADILFWEQQVGLTFGLFVAALCAVGFAHARPQRTPRDWIWALLVILVIIAPVIEQFQFLSFICTVTGAAMFFLWISATVRHTLEDLAGNVLRLLPHAAITDFRSSKHMAGRLRAAAQTSNGPARLAMGWAFPLIFGGILITLLAVANPIFDRWLLAILPNNWPLGVWALRGAFWLCLALLIWPLLQIRGFRAGQKADPKHPMPGLNAISVTNSLVLFNVILGLQTALDVIYLWGGSGLPEGMTLAAYAHRGAYPLVATALLAGLFALGSRRFVEERPLLRGLLYLWIAQNVALLMSAAYRLDLYVEVFGLTYLRVAAFIWMGLVGFGLIAVAAQVALQRPNAWLVRANTAALFATLYVCCFINFGHLIVAHNLNREAAQDHDIYYLCTLPATAAAPLRDYELRLGERHCVSSPIKYGTHIRGWRDWGFRSYRVAGYLQANPLDE